jgi:MFS family permease
MTLLAGVLADSIGPRKGVAIIGVLTVVGTFLFANAMGLPMAVIGRILMGVGTGITYVCALKIIAVWFGGERFATLTGTVMTVGYIGALLASGPLAMAIGWIGWRGSFNFIAGLALLFIVLVIALVRDKRPMANTLSKEPRSSGISKVDAPIGFFASIASVVRKVDLWKVSLFMLCFQCPVMVVQGLWAVPFMMDIYGLSKQAASNNLGMWALAVIITCPFIGYFSDHVLRSRKKVLIGADAVMALVLLVLVVFTTAVPVGLLPVLFFVGGLANSMAIVGFAFVNDLFPKHVVGTAQGLYNFWVFVGGALSQQISGMLLGQFSAAGVQASAQGYSTVFLFCFGTIVISGVAAFSLREAKVAVAEEASPALEKPVYSD